MIYPNAAWNQQCFEMLWASAATEVSRALPLKTKSWHCWRSSPESFNPTWPICGKISTRQLSAAVVRCMSVNNCKTLAPDTARKQWHKRDFVEGLAVLHARQDILTSATAKPAKVSDERWHWAACREVQNLGTSWLLTVKTGACNAFCGNACTSSLGNSTPVVQNAKSQPESCGSYRHPRQEKGIGMASVKKLDVSFSNFSNAVKWKASNCLWHERLWVSLHWALLEAPIGLSSLGINRNSAMHEADTKLAIRASAAAIVSHRTKPRWKTKNKHSSDWRGICWRVFWGISKHEDRFWIQEIWSPSLSSALCRLFKTCLGGLFEYCVPPCLLWLLQWSEFPAAEIPNKQSGSQGKDVEGSQAHLKVQLYILVRLLQLHCLQNRMKMNEKEILEYEVFAMQIASWSFEDFLSTHSLKEQVTESARVSSVCGRGDGDAVGRRAICQTSGNVMDAPCRQQGTARALTSSKTVGTKTYPGGEPK